MKLISADLKDIMFPGERKKAFAQVVKAQEEGQAALGKSSRADGCVAQPCQCGARDG